MIPIKPAGHRVLVRCIPAERVSAGGIVLPDNKREDQSQVRAELVDVGPTAWKAFDDGEPWAKPGDFVWHQKHAGHCFEHEGESFRVLNDEDVIAVEVSNAS